MDTLVWYAVKISGIICAKSKGKTATDHNVVLEGLSSLEK